MNVRKISAAVAATAVAGALACTALAPANAAGFNTTYNQGASDSSTPTASSIVFAGSDTIQYVVADLADAWNKTAAGATNPILSYNALKDDGTAVAPLTGWAGVAGTTATSITTPNGSGGGLTLLGQTDANGGSVISFARSSSAPDTSKTLLAGGSSDGTGYPFAIDTVVLAVSAKNTAAPSTLTQKQVWEIYSGQLTNWKQVGGKSGAIDVLQPKSGSGTAKFFVKSFNAIAAANGGAANTDANGITGVPTTYGAGITVAEHSGAPLEADSKAIVPISLGRAILWNKTHKNDIRIIGGYSAQRALWNFARTSKDGDAARGQTKVNPDVYAGGAITEKILGANGFFCSAAGKAIVAADGFFPLNAANCGLPKSSNGDIVTNFNAAGLYDANPLIAVPVATTKITATVSKNTVTIKLSGNAGIPAAAKLKASVKIGGKFYKVTWSKANPLAGTAKITGKKKGTKVSIKVTGSFAGDATNKKSSLTKTISYKIA